MMEEANNLDVLVFGACNTDLITYTERMPSMGETVHGYKFAVGFGGKGANQCVAAAKLGASTAMVAKLGNDTFGENYLKNLRDLGIDTRYVNIVDDSTGVAQITVSDNGDNRIIVVVGANNSLSSRDVEEAENLIEAAKVILFQFETRLEPTIRALELCSKYSCIAVVNGAPGIADIDPRILQLCNVFCVNETEAELITKLQIQSVADAEKAVTTLKSMGCKLPVITLGALGVVFIPKGEDCPVHIPVEPVKTIDTTGAGDAFLGGLAYFLAKYPEMSMHDSIKRACEIAKFSVQRCGTQISFPFRKDLPESLFE